MYFFTFSRELYPKTLPLQLPISHVAEIAAPHDLLSNIVSVERKTTYQKCFQFIRYFPKNRTDYESQKFAFRFNQKYPSQVNVFWIHDPLVEFGRKNAKKGAHFRRMPGYS